MVKLYTRSVIWSDILKRTSFKETVSQETNTSLEVILQKHKIFKMDDGKARAMLENLGLDYLITKFNSDNITADLIPRLSTEGFKIVGLTDYGTIMNLRVRCCIFWWN